MTISSARIASLILLVAAAQAWAAEPLAGSWRLTGQEVNGQKMDSDPLLLRIVPRGNTFDFAYSVPVNNIQFVSTSYEARLDGSAADVKDANGKKLGTIKITKAGPALYKVVLQGPNRPDSSGTMAVSPDGKTLTCESDTKVPGRGPTHVRQIFSRQ